MTMRSMRRTIRRRFERAAFCGRPEAYGRKASHQFQPDASGVGRTKGIILLYQWAARQAVGRQLTHLQRIASIFVRQTPRRPEWTDDDASFWQAGVRERVINDLIIPARRKRVRWLWLAWPLLILNPLLLFLLDRSLKESFAVSWYDFLKDQGSIIAGLLALGAGVAAVIVTWRAGVWQRNALEAQNAELRQQARIALAAARHRCGSDAYRCDRPRRRRYSEAEQGA